MNTEFVYFSDKLLEKEIGTISQNMVKPFWSEGKWNMHDLLTFLLKVTGPAKVWLSTFSISEASVRTLNPLIDGVHNPP